MTVPFQEASAVRLRAGSAPQSGVETTFDAHIPDLWQQGRGAFGGLVFGVLVRAARAAEPDLARLPRTFASDIAGPVLPGPAQVLVRTVRRGKSQTNLQVELRQTDELLAYANITLSSERVVSAEVPPLPVPSEASLPWREQTVLPVQPPMGPVFAQHYEYRSVGPLPFSAGTKARTAAFLAEKQALEDGQGSYDAAALTALLDAPWPAIYAISPRPLMMTTVSFSAQYLNHDTPPPRSEPLFFRARALTQSQGYSLEFRELWSQGKLVALNQQTFAILK